MREEITTFLTFLFSFSSHDHRHHNYYHRCLVSSSASLATQSHHRATSPANSVDRAKALYGCKNREEKWTTFAFNQCISASITILPTTMYYEWTTSLLLRWASSCVLLYPTDGIFIFRRQQTFISLSILEKPTMCVCFHTHTFVFGTNTKCSSDGWRQEKETCWWSRWCDDDEDGTSSYSLSAKS